MTDISHEVLNEDEIMEVYIANPQTRKDSTEELGCLTYNNETVLMLEKFMRYFYGP